MNDPEGGLGAVPWKAAQRQRGILDRVRPAQPALSRTVSAQVHGFIQHALLTGQLNPGDRLAEGELAAALGVSRTPIREALRQLGSDGLVVVVPHRGTFVRTLDPRRARELYEARLLLEPAAARAAAGRITDDQLAALRPLVDAARTDARTGNVGGASVDNEAFHLALFRAAGNDVLLESWNRVWAEWQLFRVCAWRHEPRRPGSAAAEHAALYEAVAARDEARSAELMSEHLTHAWTPVERFLATAGTRYGSGPAEFPGYPDEDRSPR